MSIGSGDKAMKKGVRRWRWHKIIGVLLSVIGFFWLSKKLGWIPAHGEAHIFWPLVLIAFGIFIIFAHGRHKRHSE